MSEMKKFRSQFNTFAPSDDGNWVKASDAEAALKAKDARIKELEALVEKMKCCENCAMFVADYSCGFGDGYPCKNWEPQQ